jgi:predicted membrane protein
MRNQGQILIGIVIIVVGLVFLIGGLLNIDTGILCLPTVLIVLGIWLLLRPWVAGRDTALGMAVFGPVRRAGTWQVADQEIWLLVGDVNLDVTEADIPLGESRIRIFAFVSTIRLLVPEGVGVAVVSTAFLTDANVLGKKREAFLTTTYITSEGYETAERKIRLEPTLFVADVKVKQK